MEPRQRTPLPGPDSGFTLVEIAVGVTVLSLGLLGLAKTMVTAYGVERIAREKQIALSWATAQMERIRSMTLAEVQSDPCASPVQGYLIDPSWGLGSGGVIACPAGRRIDLDSDGDPDYFERWSYLPGTPDFTSGGDTVVLADDALTGLRPRDGTTVLGVVSFGEPTLARSGVAEGSGLWVTVECRWKGVAGNSQVKLVSFVGK